MTSHEAWARAQLIRFGRTLTAARRRMPKILAGMIGLALVIPGPQDEILVAILIAGWLLLMKPAKRSMIFAELKAAWDIYA